MSSKAWSIGIQKQNKTKMIQHHVHIRSTDQFYQGCLKKGQK